jgi:putative ABC transport system permease protein
MLNDVRYAARALAKNPGFTIVAVLSLAIGIGANTAIFSLVYSVILRPLPYPDPDRLVTLTAYNPSMEIRSSAVSAADFADVRAGSSSFDALAALSTFSTSFSANGDAERIGVAAATPEVFDVLGTPPERGRAFRPDEARPGIAAAAVISHGLWVRKFGGDAAAIGRPLRPGNPTVVVGVTPARFEFGGDIGLWVPFALQPAGDPRNNRYLQAIGRLKRGVPLERAQAEIDAIAVRLETDYGSTNKGWRLRITPLHEDTIGDSRLTLWILLGAVGLVLLTACVNLANLLVARSEGRRRELAIRAALGAGRARILRQLITESLLLSLVGGGLGVGLAWWGVHLLLALKAGTMPRTDAAGLGPQVLAFSACISVLTGLLFGVLPAWQATSASPGSSLKDGDRTGVGPSRRRTQQLLIVGEVALALVLVSSAGLLIRSLQTLGRVDPGFDPANTLSMRVALSGPRYRAHEAVARFYETAVERIAAIPGVRSAAAVLSLPLDGGGFGLGRGFIIPGEDHPAEGYTAMYRTVTPGYFRTLSTPLRAGRDFNADDRSTSSPVVIVNETLARRYFAGRNPIGRRIHVWVDQKEPREIVGVAADLHAGGLAQPPIAEVFVPISQDPLADMTFVVRTAGAPAQAVSAIRTAIASVDRSQAVFAIRTLDDVFAASLAASKFNAILVGAFAGFALVLAAVGIYGVVAYTVGRRRQEMAVRVALGARPGDVFRLIVGEGMTVVCVGVALGIAGAVASGRVIGGLLFGVGAHDPAILAGAVVTLVLAALFATVWPARQVLILDPLSTLKAE